MTDETTVPNWGKLLDFTIIGVKMDVLHKANLKDGPPTPLLMTDFQNMAALEELKVKDMISVVHYPREPPGFKKCTNPEHILAMDGPMFGHSATTQGGSSGCPVFREFERRWIVVGLHRGDLKRRDKTIITNIATRMSVICDVFMGKPYNGHVPDIEKSELTKESTASSDGDPVPSSTKVDTSDDTGPMKKWNHSALVALKGKLKFKVEMDKGLLDLLEKDAGGFMSDQEARMVRDKPTNSARMEELIQILSGKSNAAFNAFCTMLHESSNETWAEELEKKAKEFKEKS